MDFGPANRIEPGLPASARKTYGLLRPAGTHWRPASCAEVDCAHHRNGWRVRVEALAPELEHTARHSDRRFHEEHVAEGETWLVFEPGQPCFAAATHQVEVGREPLFVVRGGDWRGNPAGTPTRVHDTAEGWRDDFGEHQDKLADRHRQG